MHSLMLPFWNWKCVEDDVKWQKSAMARHSKTWNLIKISYIFCMCNFQNTFLFCVVFISWLLILDVNQSLLSSHLIISYEGCTISYAEERHRNYSEFEDAYTVWYLWKPDAWADLLKFKVKLWPIKHYVIWDQSTLETMMIFTDVKYVMYVTDMCGNCSNCFPLIIKKYVCRKIVLAKALRTSNFLSSSVSVIFVLWTKLNMLRRYIEGVGVCLPEELI